MPTADSYNDTEVLQRLSEGDEVAFQQLYNTYWNKIYSLALAYLKSSQLAQDTVQEVFVKVWKNRKTLPGVKDPAAYIYIMGRNAVINELKKKISTIDIDEAHHSIPDDFMLPHRAVDLKELQSRIETAISRLPAQQQTIIKLSREEGLSHKEIADRVGIEKVTVKNHIVRALNTLRNQLSKGNQLLVLYLLSQLFTRN